MNSVSRFLSFDIKDMCTHIPNSDPTNMFKKNFKICEVIKLQMKFFQCVQLF